MIKKSTLKIGDTASIKNVISSKMIDDFAIISNDNNPIHLDEEYASKTIFKKRIAHGLLVSSFISATIGQSLPGFGSIYLSQSLKFLAPVFINDEITTLIEVLAFPRVGRVLLKTECLNQDNKIVIKGEALVIPPKDTELII
ncbi:MAG: MaoC family dehydratase [Melioribacteraceae bacterium]|nr:MaoC family dehydratase [Melioribacteraceae bacterium]